VGSGKTVFLGRIQDQLRQEGQIEVAESLTFDVPRVNLDTLKLALYDDLATDKDGDLPSKTDKSERAFMNVMRRCQKPIVLFVDDGHDVHGQTLRGLKPLIEKTSRRGARLTIGFCRKLSGGDALGGESSLSVQGLSGKGVELFDCTEDCLPPSS
jgi:type II secretory pathway predicted ATPase ExeA